MDMYGNPAQDSLFRIDDLLDFSNDELFSASPTDSGYNPPPENSSGNRSSAAVVHRDFTNPISSTDFTTDLCVPNDDAAQLEWLSQFVEDSFTDFPANEFDGAANARSEASFHGRSRSKRTRPASANTSWFSSSESESNPTAGKTTTVTTSSRNSTKKKDPSQDSSSSMAGEQSSPGKMTSEGVRRCAHCASEKTPQWRAGPLGPKTLCNACGVRFKSGRLVPEYRPAASPTFVLTQHSNSHRKVMELRRQKEILRQEQEQKQQQQLYHHHHHHHHHHQDFEVC
ncbi:GATA transcription factor 4 [Malania oleifera]|uniref:GATA transcription factor 4 n=1 Tax=Malania oleifera TaxID=397392 RepID=UPI0025AE9D2A|nr:GATA transcription factor 4 [Malania oleifera]